jgi:predicted RNA-binding Zn-ribbon protein involved in translation (DUF1610 family)
MADVLASITAAIATVRKLKEVSDKIRDAEIKGLVADIQIELAEVKSRLADVLNENTQLKSQLLAVDKPQFPPCPSCGSRTWRVEKSVRDPTFGDLGGIRQTFKCSSCNFTEQKLVT